MWKAFLTLSLSVPLLAGVSSCSHTRPIPRWEGKIYAGDPVAQAMVRKQAGEEIKASDPQFRDLMAMKWKGKDGFEGFIETYVYGCKEWKKEVPMTTVLQMMQDLEKSKHPEPAPKPTLSPETEETPAQ